MQQICFSQYPYFLTGTYTDNSNSKGIYVYRYDAKSHRAEQAGFIESSNPSYLTISRNGNYVYAVNENPSGSISAYAFNKKTGALRFINSVPSMGGAPCYITLDATQQWLVTGNYSGGNFSIYHIEKNGAIGNISQTVDHKGSGMDKERQAKPHVHCTIFNADNKFLYVSDLGIDKVVRYSFDAKTGRAGSRATDFNLPAGSGSRHIALAKNGELLYVMAELTGAINVFSTTGTPTLLQTINGLQSSSGAAGADLHLSADGKFLYASQRSNNTIQQFTVLKNGQLQYDTAYDCGGNWPRNFSINPAGNLLLAANQKNNNIVFFNLNKKDGSLSQPVDSIKIDKPVCIQWVP